MAMLFDLDTKEMQLAESQGKTNFNPFLECIQGVSMEVPAQSAPTFHIFNNCINNDRDITDYNITFEPVPVITDHPGMYELTGLLADKKINSEDYGYSVIPSEIFVPIQMAVDEVAHKGELSSASREALRKLPGK